MRSKKEIFSIFRIQLIFNTVFNTVMMTFAFISMNLMLFFTGSLKIYKKEDGELVANFNKEEFPLSEFLLSLCPTLIGLLALGVFLAAFMTWVDIWAEKPREK